jgi:hypothetical protein
VPGAEGSGRGPAEGTYEPVEVNPNLAEFEKVLKNAE